MSITCHTGSATDSRQQYALPANTTCILCFLFKFNPIVRYYVLTVYH